MEELDPVLTRFRLAHVDLENRSDVRVCNTPADRYSTYLNGLDVLTVPDAVERLVVKLQERAERLDHRLASVMVHHVDLVWLWLTVASVSCSQMARALDDSTTHTEKLVQTACELLRRLEIATEGLLHNDSQEGLCFPQRCRLRPQIFVDKLAALMAIIRVPQ